MVPLGWLIVVELLACGAVTWFWLRRYISWRRSSKIVYFMTFFGWFLAMGIAVLLPADIAGTQYEQCLAGYGNSSLSSTNESQDFSSTLAYSSSYPPTSSTPTGSSVPSAVVVGASALAPNGEECFCIVYVPKIYLYIAWTFLYWTTFILCWTVYPVMQTYTSAGDFTVLEKIRTSIKENVIFYIVAGAALGLFLILFLVWSREGNVVGVAMSCSNAYCLLLYFTLLSYGLVYIPQSLWRNGGLEKRLKYCQFQVVPLHRDYVKYREQYVKTLQQVKLHADTMDDADPYRYLIDIIVAKCPPEFQQLKGTGNSDITYDGAVKLHYNVMNQYNLLIQSQSVYRNTLKDAFILEDVLKSSGRSEHEMQWSFKPRITNRFLAFCEWVWHCYIKPNGFRVAAIFCALFSFVVVFSEVTLRWDDPVLSIFALMIQPTAIRSSDLLLTLVLSGPLIFMVVSAYNSLFQLKLFTYYRLLPDQQSDGNSVLFSAAYLCRLAPPLAFNFLYVIKFQGTAFEEVMSYMKNVPFFGGEVFLENIPWVIVPMCLLHAFDIIPRCIRMLPFKKLKRFIYDDDFGDSQIEEGQDLIKSERAGFDFNSTGSLNLLQAFDEETPGKHGHAADSEPQKPAKKPFFSRFHVAPPEPTPVTTPKPTSYSYKPSKYKSTARSSHPSHTPSPPPEQVVNTAPKASSSTITSLLRINKKS